MAIFHFEAFKLLVSYITTNDQTAGIATLRESLNQMIIGFLKLRSWGSPWLAKSFGLPGQVWQQMELDCVNFL